MPRRRGQRLTCRDRDARQDLAHISLGLPKRAEDFSVVPFVARACRSPRDARLAFAFLTFSADFIW